MNVKQSEEITDVIRDLRLNIYNTDLFFNTFNNYLKSSINATSIKYIPDNLGGWNIHVEIDEEKCENKKSEFYIGSVCFCLKSTIDQVCYMTSDNLGILQKIMKTGIENLVNVIISGQNSIMIKI